MGEFAVVTTGLSRKQVIVPLDGSPADMTVAGIAATIAAQLACELVLVRLVPPCLPPLFLSPLPQRECAALERVLRDRTERLLDQAHRELSELKWALDWRYVSHVVLAGQSQTAAVCEFVAGRPVELIVVAAAEYGGQRRRAGGDLAASITHKHGAPVLKVVCSAGPPAVEPMPETHPSQRPARCRMKRLSSRVG